jgi:hypothetical protein
MALIVGRNEGLFIPEEVIYLEVEAREKYDFWG